MRKSMWTLAVIVLTAAILLMMTVSSGETVTEAEFVRVERADVHQVVPIYGKLVYEDNLIISAQTPGVAAHVCVNAGERVGAQAALVRMETPYNEGVLSALAAGQMNVSEMDGEYLAKQLLESVIRAEQACTVRDIYVEEGAAVTAGMPLLRVSSHMQRIVCSAALQDAEKINPGMWAWLTTEGEELCFATVETVGQKTVDALTGLEVQEIVLIPEKEIELSEFSVVDADIYLAGSDDVLSLPLDSITERGTVWWVNEERCTEIPAQIVLRDEMRAWVQLPEGMTVAVGEFIEGQRVREACP